MNKPIRRAAKTQVQLTASDLEPGHVVLELRADEYMLSVNMAPDEWIAFMQAATTIAIEAHNNLLAACRAENQINPELS